MEGLSRAYVRSGYLGIVFTKVGGFSSRIPANLVFLALQIANALVRICTASLQTLCTRRDSRDSFWDTLNSAVQSRIKSGQPQSDHPFFTHLALCLQVKLSTVCCEMEII